MYRLDYKLTFNILKTYIKDRKLNKLNYFKVSLEGYLTMESMTEEILRYYKSFGNGWRETLYIGLVGTQKEQKADFIVRHKKYSFIQFSLKKKHINKYSRLLDKLGLYYRYNKGVVSLGTSLKDILDKTDYKDYMGQVRVYGIYRGLSTTKLHIGKIWKVDILDDDGKTIDSFEK